MLEISTKISTSLRVYSQLIASIFKSSYFGLIVFFATIFLNNKNFLRVNNIFLGLLIACLIVFIATPLIVNYSDSSISYIRTVLLWMLPIIYYTFGTRDINNSLFEKLLVVMVFYTFIEFLLINFTSLSIFDSDRLRGRLFGFIRSEGVAHNPSMSSALIVSIYIKTHIINGFSKKFFLLTFASIVLLSSGAGMLLFIFAVLFFVINKIILLALFTILLIIFLIFFNQFSVEEVLGNLHPKISYEYISYLIDDKFIQFNYFINGDLGRILFGSSILDDRVLTSGDFGILTIFYAIGLFPAMIILFGVLMIFIRASRIGNFAPFLILMIENIHYPIFVDPISAYVMAQYAMMKKRKPLDNKTIVLSATNYFSIAKFRYSFVKKIIENKYKVILYASDDNMSDKSLEKLEELGATCIRSNVSRGSYSPIEAVRYIYRYSRVIRKFSPSIVINCSLQPMVLGGILCRFGGIKNISLVTGLGSQYHNNSFIRLLVKLSYRLIINYSSQVWFVSKSDARVGIEKLKVNPNKIKIVYGAGIQINPKLSSLDRNKNLKIISMGRIRRDKGVKDFIDLSEKLAKDNRFSLQLMGNIDSSDEYVNSIVSQANDDGLIKRIDFKYDNVEFLRSADVLLSCSRHEGMPTVIIEAMANFVIPVAANLPVIEELNNMGAKIYSYNPGNIESLYEKLTVIEKTTLQEKEEILSNNFKFVSLFFEKEAIANLQYKYFIELVE
jgi:glycosyltransferase involved in cell wall biosynthesis